MAEGKKIRGNPNPERRLLEKLREFEQAAKTILEQRTEEQKRESLENLRVAVADLRGYLAQHLAPKELAEWGEMPDSDLEIATFGSELKMEHSDLQRELSQLLRDIDEYDRALDRREAMTQIWSTCKALATRIARHAGGEEAELGRYTA